MNINSEHIERFYKKAINGKEGNVFTRLDALEELLKSLQVGDISQYITNITNENKEIIIPSLLGGETDPTSATFSGIVISPSGQTIDGVVYSFAIVVDGVVVSGVGDDGTTVIVGGTGDVLGPASAVDGNIAVFDGVTGKLIKDGLLSIGTNVITNIGADIALLGGDAAVVDAAGGSGAVSGGAGNGSGSGGTGATVGGTGGATGNGGAASLEGGVGGSTSGNGGNATVRGGDATTDGNGGGAYIAGGNGVNNGDGGDVTIYGGSGDGSGADGAIFMTGDTTITGGLVVTGIFDVDNINIKTGLADGEYSGDSEAAVAGATLAFGNLVYLQTADSRWEKVDASARATCCNRVGICVLAAANDGDATRILSRGNVRADAVFPAMDIGGEMYASTTAGEIQALAPSSNAGEIIRHVGHANTANELHFEPSGNYYEIG